MQLLVYTKINKTVRGQIMKYKKLFTPVKVGKVTIKNRFALGPMGPLGLADAEGGFNQRGIDYSTSLVR